MKITHDFCGASLLENPMYLWGCLGCDFIVILGPNCDPVCHDCAKPMLQLDELAANGPKLAANGTQWTCPECGKRITID